MPTRQASPTFSDVWYKVAQTRPRVSPHARIVRQRFGGGTAYVIEETAGNAFFRLSEAAYRFVGLLDGSRTADEAWEACASQIGDDAPTQSECIELLSTLDSSGLLIGDTSVWADMLEHRQAASLTSHRRKRTGLGLFPCLPLINPDRALDRCLHLYRWLFDWRGAALWTSVMLVALVMLVSNARRFANELDLSAMLDSRNLAIVGIVFLCLRIIHELGHAMACKAMGGRCTEIGVMLVAMILPLPYCDATSSWAFPATRRRVLVAAAGVYVEMFIAAIAAILWARSDPGLFSAVCRNVMVVSGVATLLFNLNPLLRYDGYYILSDVLGIPNLSQRANELWKHGITRYAFGVRGGRPPLLRDRKELIIVAMYAAMSVPYRIFVTLTICLVVAQKYSSLGLVLGVLCFVMMVVWPILKGIGYLLVSPALLGRRVRAISAVAGAAGVVTVVLGLIPVREHVDAPGWIHSTSSAVVRAGENGYVAEVLAHVGHEVNAGDPLLRLENPELTATYLAASARLAQAEAALDEASIKSPADRRAAQAQLAFATEDAAEAASRMESLTLRAAESGTLVATGASATDWENLQGSFVSKGALLGRVVSLKDVRVRTLVDDRDFEHAFSRADSIKARVRVRGLAGRDVPVRIERIAPAGSLDVANPAMANVAGGEVAVRQTQEGRYETLSPQFVVDLLPLSDSAPGMIGQRVRARFLIDRRPLASQWLRRLEQFWDERFGG